MERSEFVDSVDSDGNTNLHLVARLAPKEKLAPISGEAFQMLYEFQWFKEVEKLVSPPMRGLRNRDGKTAYVVFADKHKHLKRKGEQWMKHYGAFLVFMTFIMSINFLVIAYKLLSAISPIHLDSWEFKKMLIADVIGTLTCIVSILMFMSIIISSFTEDDFLYDLPKRFCIGLASLISSIGLCALLFVISYSVYTGLHKTAILVYCVFLAISFQILNQPSLRLMFSLAFPRGKFGSNV